MSAEILTHDGAWCWFQDPRSVYLNGKHERTYANWMKSDGMLVVGFFDHEDQSTHSIVVKENWDVDDHYSGGLSLNHQNPFQVCGSVQIEEQFEIVYCTSKDGGIHWDEQFLTKHSGMLNVRPVIPRGISSENIHVLFMKGKYRHYTDYQTSIAWETVYLENQNH